MTRLSLLLAMILLPLGLPASLHGAEWQRDVNTAMQLAKTHRRPILLFITMDGCKYCNKMVQTTLSDPHVRQQLGDRYISAVVRSVERPELIKRLAIRSFPTTLVVDPNGKILDQMTGYVDARSFWQRLQHFAARDPQVHRR